MILESLSIDYRYYNGVYSFECPVHGGDNKSGCTVFEGKYGVPNWRCWTHNCHEQYGKSLKGFISGVLSFRSGSDIKQSEVAKFLKNNKIELEKTSYDYEKIKINKRNNIFLPVKDKNTKKVDRAYIRSNITIPSPYFLNRGFSAEILDKFDVGDSNQEGKMMYNRAVVPVYDINNEYAGCCGRTIENHPDKWVYSFYKGNFLYGLNFALPKIMETGLVYIVEGNPDLWRFFSLNCENTVAIMGVAFTDEHLKLLEKSGALNVVIMTDMDEAGRKAAEMIIEKCGRRFNYYVPEYNAKDPGEAEEKELLEIIKTYDRKRI